MMTLRDSLIEQALTASPEDRDFVADALEQSLASGGLSGSDIATAWNTEIDRRIEAYDQGVAEAEPFDAALELIRRNVAQMRLRRVQS